MTSMSITVKDYTNRVLGVIKEKYGLKDKAEALNKFAEMFGDEFVERDVDEKLLKEMIKDCEKWETKHKFVRKMTVKELDRLFGIET